MMKRVLAFCLLGAIAATGYVMLNRQDATLSLVGAKAFAMAQRPSMYMVTLTVENTGAPDVILSASTPDADMITVVNPQHSGSVLVVPGESQGILAMDGAHVMLRMDDFAEGSFIPLTLTFENAGEVVTRLQNAGVTTMSHDPSTGVATEPAPSVSLQATDAPNADGFSLRIEVENFTFYRPKDEFAEDPAHVAGQGHGHLYLNGLKLGRVYEPGFDIGQLPAGDHVLEVALNTNDHRPYLAADGRPVVARLEIQVAE
ncbi:copper chaperone PCu(A)C [Sulfitobacter pacificus]|uniref:copper chaperone PCu(A)C n=1 Tax=Sulfitobacter pacificus TaxID=1499314 RepID=UPI0031092837